MPRFIGPVGVAAAITVAAAPLWVTDVVPVIDYPAHFTRMVLLARDTLDPVTASIYAIDPAIRPNLAMDLVVPAFASLLGVTLATKLFIATALGMWIVGPVAIHRAVWGRFGAESLVAFFFALNAPFFAGFYNFHFGIGLTFLATAAWLVPSRLRWWVVAPVAVAAVAALISHLMAFAVLGLVLFGIEVGRPWRPDEPGLGDRVARLAATFAPGLLVHTVFAASTGTGGGPLTFNLLANLAAPFLYASRAGGMIDPLPAIGVGVVALAAWRSGTLRIAPILRPVLGLAAAAMLVSPSEAFGGAMIHWRMAPILLALFVAAWRIDLPPRSGRRVAAAFLTLALATTAIQAARWREDGRTIDAARAAVAAVTPEGGRVLTALTGGDALAFTHVGDLAIIDRHAFSPSFFTDPAQSPIRLRPAFAAAGAAGSAAGGALFAAELADLADPAATSEAARRRRHLAGWPCRFDTLVVLGRGAAEASPTGGVETTARGPAHAVHRIVRPASGCPAGG